MPVEKKGGRRVSLSSSATLGARTALGVAVLYLIVHVAVKAAFFPTYFLGNDSPTYITPAITFVEHLSFSEMIFRTPIYPIFLAAHRAVFGNEHWLIVASYSQIGCAALAVGVLMRILAGEGVRAHSIFAFGIIMLINPANFFYENRILTEALAFLWVALLAWCAWQVHRANSARSVIVLAFVAGIGPLLRPDYAAVSIFVLLYLGLLRGLRKAGYGAEVGVGAAALIIFPSLLWAARNYMVYSFFGLSALMGAALMFHTHENIEAGRTEYNAPAVDRLLEFLKQNKNPGVVFEADPLGEGVEQRVLYWQRISDATFRAILARPWQYAGSVGRALVAMTNPALGKSQWTGFYGFSSASFRLYQVAHFFIFGITFTLAFVFALPRLFRLRQLDLDKLYVLFVLGVIASYYLFTCGLIVGPNNRYRMPFDGLILAMGILCYKKRAYSKIRGALTT